MGAWMIRAGRGGVYATDWLERGLVGIGWDFGGVDIASMSREQIKAAYASSHPDENKDKVADCTAQVFQFAHDMEKGSTVVMYDPEKRLYHIGTVSGPCEPVTDEEGVTYTRAVKWGQAAKCDALQASSKNSLGGIQTIFSVSDEVLADLRAAAKNNQGEKASQCDVNKTFENLSKLLALGAAVTTVFSLTASFSLHLTRSIESGYPLFLAQISAADIVPMLPSVAAMLLISFPALLGLFKVIPSLERLADTGLPKLFSASLLVPIFVLVPPGLLICFVLCISDWPIGRSLIAYGALFLISMFIWAVLAKRSFSSQSPGLSLSLRQRILELTLNSLYVGVSIVVASFIMSFVQMFQPLAPLILLVAVLLAICSSVAFKYCMDKIHESSNYAQNGNMHSIYFIGMVVVLLAAFALGMCMEELPGDQRYVAYENANSEITGNKASQSDAIVEEAEAEYLILDTLANGTAVVTANDKNESAKSYKVISLVNGYSIRADSI